MSPWRILVVIPLGLALSTPFLQSASAASAPVRLAQVDGVALEGQNEDEPTRPWLPQEHAPRVVELEGETKVANLALDDASLERAIAAGGEALALRREHQSGWRDEAGQPAEWWEVAASRRRLEFLRFLLSQEPSTREALVEPQQQAERLLEAGEPAEALRLLEGQLAVRHEVLGADHPESLESLYWTAQAQSALGRVSDAEQSYREVMERCRVVLGEENPTTVSHIRSVGTLLLRQGHVVEAEPYFREALRKARRVLGDEQLFTLMCVRSLGDCLRDAGRSDEAALLFREALDGRRRILGEDHVDTVRSKGDLGRALLDLGQWLEAEPYYRETLEARRRLLGDDHPETLKAVHSMGYFLSSTGRKKEAERYYRESLERKRALFGEDDLTVLVTLYNLGVILRDQWRFQEGEPLLLDALEGFRRTLGSAHWRTLLVQESVGVLLGSMGRAADAELYYRGAYRESERSLGEEHPRTISALNSLAGSLLGQEDYAEALDVAGEALRRGRRSLGNDHPHVAHALMTSGRALARGDGSNEAAEPLFREAFELLRRSRGLEDVWTQESVFELGRLLLELGELEEAERYLTDAAEVFLRADDQHKYGITLSTLGWLYRIRGELEPAERVLRESLELSEQLRLSATGGERARAALSVRLGLGIISGDLASVLVERDRPAEAWTVAERGRSRALLDLLTRNGDELESLELESDTLRLARAAEEEARLRAAEAESRHAHLRAVRERVASAADLDEAQRSARLADLDAELESSHERIQRARQTLGEAGMRVSIQFATVLPDARPSTVEEITQALDDDELILAYVWSSRAVSVLTASGSTEPEGFCLTRTQAATEALAAEIEAVRSTLSEGGGAWSGAPREAAARLADRLLPEGVRSRIAGCTRLVILPDGPLRALPFDALVQDWPDHPLGQGGVQIAYASSATVYLTRRAVAAARVDTARADSNEPGTSRPAPPPSIVALGDPRFQRAREVDEPDYPTSGLLVLRADPGGNGAGGGLARGDVLLSYGGAEVSDAERLSALTDGTTPGEEAGAPAADGLVRIRYWRDGSTHETSVEPGSLGVSFAQTRPDQGLRALADTSRALDERALEASLLDQVRLYGGSLSPLPGTRAEVERISEVAASAGLRTQVLLGERATLTRLEAALPGARYVHLATHGLAGSADRPYDASLALTLPAEPTPEDPGFLTLDHLIRTWHGKLEHCDLVVLSACDTQRGIKRGDNLIALPWGFFFAGSPTVVASLWQVDDRATSFLMGRFFENLLGAHAETRHGRGAPYEEGEPMPKSDALAEAKRWLRTWNGESRSDASEPRGLRPLGSAPSAQTARAPYEHPHYWAAFVLIGDPE